MISFRKLTFANFLSVGNQPVSVDLDKCKTTLVHGTNGSGKSTILDALCYVLFNRPFRKINLPQLINSQNKKGLLVECEFKVGNNRFLIRRGMKPRIFEAFKNGEIIDSKAADKDNQTHIEQNILKLTFKSFTQIVILGSSNFIPFMQLNTAGRRECVEDFLDIKIFSVMGIMAKERLRGLKEQLTLIEKDIDTHEFRIETQQEKIRFMMKTDDGQVEALEKKIRDAEAEILRCEVCLKQWQFDVKEHKAHMAQVSAKDPHKQVKQLNNVIIKMNAKLERLLKEKDFFDQDACPTCGQDIEYALKMGAQSKIQNEMEEVDKASIKASELMSEQQKIVEYYTELNDKLLEFNNKQFELETELKGYRRVIKNAQSEIDTIQNDTDSIEKEEGILLEMEREITQIKKRKQELVKTIGDHDIVTGLLKDSGIKTQIVKKYLPAMNKYIRNYLTLLDFPIHFQLDDGFNEQVKSPMHQDFSYQSFSEGQKGRIDLALMFTWREIGRLKNSVRTNLLILDEVFSSSLDDTGKECLLQLLRYKLPDDQRVIVVDHTLSDAFKEKFDYNIEVTRKGGFSRYE